NACCVGIRYAPSKLPNAAGIKTENNHDVTIVELRLVVADSHPCAIIRNRSFFASRKTVSPSGKMRENSQLRFRNTRISMPFGTNATSADAVLPSRRGI